MLEGGRPAPLEALTPFLALFALAFLPFLAFDACTQGMLY